MKMFSRKQLLPGSSTFKTMVVRGVESYVQAMPSWQPT